MLYRPKKLTKKDVEQEAEERKAQKRLFTLPTRSLRDQQRNAEYRAAKAVEDFKERRRLGLMYEESQPSTDEDEVIRVGETPKKRKRYKGPFGTYYEEDVGPDTEELIFHAMDETP